MLVRSEVRWGVGALPSADGKGRATVGGLSAKRGWPGVAAPPPRRGRAPPDAGPPLGEGRPPGPRRRRG